jgi:hypothetical protein
MHVCFTCLTLGSYSQGWSEHPAEVFNRTDYLEVVMAPVDYKDHWKTIREKVHSKRNAVEASDRAQVATPSRCR